MDYHNKRQRVISRARGLNASAALSPDGRSVALALSRDGKMLAIGGADRIGSVHIGAVSATRL